MQPNVGAVGRLLRLIVGLGLVALALFSGLPALAEPLWFWTTLGLGVVLFGTAVAPSCPLCALFSTCKASR